MSQDTKQSIIEYLERQTGLSCAEQNEDREHLYLTFGFPQLICYVYQMRQGRWKYVSAYWVNRSEWNSFGHAAEIAGLARREAT